MSTMKIAQYNVQKSKLGVMTPLIHSTSQYDVIAIQEPWLNPHMQATYCPSDCPYTAIFPSTGRARTCFLINKAIPVSSWSHDQSMLTPDYCQITFQLPTGRLTIHNIYSQMPPSTNTTEWESPIPAMLQNIQNDNSEHLVVGDFNLHHQMWGGDTVKRAHKGATYLVEAIEMGTLQLLSSRGVSTREKHGNRPSTLDLTLATPSISRQIVSCEVDRDTVGSDHFPVITTLKLLHNICRKQTTRRNFKMLDSDLVKLGATDIVAELKNLQLNTMTEVDYYCHQLVQKTQGLIAETVPIAKPTTYAKPWWNSTISAAIRNERQLKRQWRRSHTQQAWDEAMSATAVKKKLIKEAKRAHWRASIHEAATSGEGIWRIAKWARTRSHLPPEPAKMPDLNWNDKVYCTAEQKAEALGERFYPLTNAKLDDIDTEKLFIDDYSSEQAIHTTATTTIEEIQNIIAGSRPDKCPGSDGIPNRFLKAMGSALAEMLTKLINACFRLSYFPKQFRHARTIVLRKPGKPNYSDPGAWRPIALLNTLGKILEAVLARKITDLAENHRLLPSSQMGNRKQRSTETALELLLEQVHTIWGLKKVASVLSLDIAGAFDTVNHTRLLDNLRIKGLPRWLIQIIGSFLHQRSTTLVVDGEEVGPRELYAGIPQGSPLSPILFLFYNGPLLERLASTNLPISPLGFADDINLLAFGNNTASNCRALEQAHGICLQWAENHGMKFALHKYTFTHFTRQRLQDINAIINLEHVTVSPTPSVRILGVLLDSKLNFRAHRIAIKTKMATQLNALYRTTASTWGATLPKARQLYTAIIRASLTYGATAWHSPNLRLKDTAKDLQKHQNVGLRIVLGAFKRCSISQLHTESYVPPLHLWLNGKIALFRARIEASGIRAQIKDACYTIQLTIQAADGIRSYRPLAPIATAGTNSRQWALNWLGGSFEGCEGKIKKLVLQDWTDYWREGSQQTHSPWQLGPQSNIPANTRPTAKVLQLHRTLKKAESSILIQMRTRCIGLKKFLFECRIPDIDSPMCACGGGEETAEHIAMLCPLESSKRHILLDDHGRRQTWSKLIGKAMPAKQLTRWLIESERIHQFSLARKLLYPNELQE